MRRLLVVSVLVAMIGGGCTCLDLGAFHSFACEPDGGPADQCPGDGVCGLEGTCHARGDEQAWQCNDDTNCEGDWRCGPERLCLDPGDEALVPASASGLTVRTFDAPLPDGLPAHVSGDPEGFPVTVPTCDNFGEDDAGYRFSTRFARSSTLVLEGALYKVINWGSGRPVLEDGGYPTIADCAPDSGIHVLRRNIDVLSTPLPAVRAMAELGPTTYVLQDGGRLCRYTVGDLLSFPPAECSLVFSPSSPPERLRVTSGLYAVEPLLLGLTDQTLQVHHLGSGDTDPVRSVYGPDGGVQRINDAIAYGAEPVVLAATPAGVLGRRLDGFRIQDPSSALPPDEWEPIDLDFEVPCAPRMQSGVVPPEPLRFSLTYRNDGAGLLAVSHRSTYSRIDGGFREDITTLSSGSLDGAGSPYSGCSYAPGFNSSTPSPTGFHEHVRNCQVCPDNSRLRWFWLREEEPIAANEVADVSGEVSSPLKIEAHCENPDGGFDLTVVDVTGRCEAPDGKDNLANFDLEIPLRGARYVRPLVVDQSSTTTMTVADDLGHLWQTDFSWALAPWSLDRAPDYLVRWDSLLALRQVETYGRVRDIPLELLPEKNFDESAEGYLLSRDNTIPLLTAILGDSSWVLVSVNIDGGGDLVGVFELLPAAARREEDPTARPISRLPSFALFGAPYHGAVTTTSDGRKILIITAFDTLMSVDVTAVASAPIPQVPFSVLEIFGSPEPAVRFTAVDHAPVTSLTVLSASPEQFVEGYLIQASRVFNFKASNINVWRAEEVVLEDFTEPVAVFADGTRARVGLKTGLVYSLPSQLPLSSPLPATAQPVSQYTQHCGHLFATARDGVYRLAVGSDPRGTWERLALPTTLTYEDAKVFGEGNELRVFTADGKPFALSGFECPAG